MHHLIRREIMHHVIRREIMHHLIRDHASIPMLDPRNTSLSSQMNELAVYGHPHHPLLSYPVACLFCPVMLCPVMLCSALLCSALLCHALLCTGHFHLSQLTIYSGLPAHLMSWGGGLFSTHEHCGFAYTPPTDRHHLPSSLTHSLIHLCLSRVAHLHHP
jgi:hypothetical protein